jgi:hypothetical protein
LDGLIGSLGGSRLPTLQSAAGSGYLLQVSGHAPPIALRAFRVYPCRKHSAIFSTLVDAYTVGTCKQWNSLSMQVNSQRNISEFYPFISQALRDPKKFQSVLFD